LKNENDGVGRDRIMKFTKDDLEFLKLVGIRADDGATAAEEEFSTEHDPTLKFLQNHHLPVTPSELLSDSVAGASTEGPRRRGRSGNPRHS